MTKIINIYKILPHILGMRIDFLFNFKLYKNQIYIKFTRFLITSFKYVVLKKMNKQTSKGSNMK